VKFLSSNAGALWFLPAYLLKIAATQNNGSAALQKSIEGLVPLNKRNEKFERCLTLETMTIETKTFFTINFIDTCINEYKEAEQVKLATQQQQELEQQQKQQQVTEQHQKQQQETEQHQKHQQVTEKHQKQRQVLEQHLRQPETTQESLDLVDVDTLSPELQQEVRDVKILEAICEEDVEAAIEIFLINSKVGLFPKGEATQALVQLLVANNDTQSLSLLFRGSPEDSQHRDLFYKEITNMQFRDILNLWEEKDKQLDAWINIIELYRTILADRFEGRISRVGSEGLVGKCRQISKLFVESNIGSENSFEDAIRSGGLRLASEYRDVFVLLSFWEALFFSNKFESQQKAEKIMDDFPQLVGLVDIDSVIARASRFNKEDIFRRLLELNLRHEKTTTTYHKSRSFEALLANQTKYSKVEAGEQTIKTAKTMNIRITADYLLDFMALKKSSDLTASTSFLESLKNIFRRPK